MIIMQKKIIYLIISLLIVLSCILRTLNIKDDLNVIAYCIGGIGIIALLFYINQQYHFICVNFHKSNIRNPKGNANMNNGGKFIVPIDVEDKLSVIQNDKDPSKNVALEVSIALNTNNDKCYIEITSNKKSTIFYSINGTTFSRYYKILDVSYNCKIMAYAESDDQKSEIKTETINIFKIEKPTINLTDGIVNITTETKGCLIFYSIDGSIPSKDSNVFQNPFKVEKSCVIKAIATKENWTDSEVVSQNIKVLPSKKDRIRKFTNEENVIGISYRGDSHIKSETPCQDYHHYFSINKVWNVAIVSDGAGSAKNSSEGSRAVCAAFKYYIENLIKADKELLDGNILDAKTWDIEFKGMVTQFQKDLKKSFVKDTMPFESFAATIILFVFSEKGYMVGHVGDGRAGVKVGGIWKSIISPHKGEEANQTIFSTSKYLGVPNLKMSGIYVPETNVSNEKIDAFVLMSDGCENGAWVTYQRKELPNNDFRIQDVNLPRENSLEKCLEIFKKPLDKRQNDLLDYITESSNAFINEPDDKTILLGRK